MKSIIYASLAILLAVAAVCVVAQEDEEYNLFKNFEHFIHKFGHKAVDFLKCMGPSFTQHCSGETMHCLAAHNTKECLSLLKCEGKDAKECIHHL